MIIRKYDHHDCKQVWDLNTIAMHKEGIFLDESWYDDLLNIEETYFHRGGEFLVAEENGVLVAMGAFQKTDSHSAWVTKMRVHPDHQRKGYGKKLLAYLEQRAKEMGYTQFHLETSEQQVAAQQLYIRSGYEEVERRVIEGFHCVVYEKNLEVL